MSSSDARLFSEAFQALNQGRLEQAERGFRKFLRDQPRHPGALNLYAIALLKSGRYQEAEPILRKAIAVDSSSDITFYNYGLVLKQLSKPLEALQAFTRALEIKPSVAETWNNRGTVFRDLTRYAEALSDFDRAIALVPNYAEAYLNKANSLFADDRFREAGESYDRATTLSDKLAHAWLGKANVLVLRAQFAAENNDALYEEALKAFGRVFALQPDLAEAWIGCGQVHTGLKNKGEASKAYETALDLYRTTLKAKPKLFEAWLGCGVVHRHLEQYDQALAAYDEALAINPSLPDALLGRGNTLNMLLRYEEASQAFEAALALNPRLAPAWAGRGRSLTGSARWHDARAAFEQALNLRPDSAEAWVGIGNIFSNMEQTDKAVSALENALKIRPGMAEVWYVLGEVYVLSQQYVRAAEAMETCLTKQGELDFVKGQLANTYALLCDWAPLEPLQEECRADMRAGLTTTPPFASLLIGKTAAEQFACARAFAAAKFLPSTAPVERRPRHSDGRIRVAYMSADFKEHPVTYLSAAVFEHHDRSKFEIIALSTHSDDGSPAQQRIMKAFDRFHDVSAMSNQDTAQLLIDAGCDILVDLTGQTYGGRTAVMALRPAPVQVNWLGYAGTMGADYYDYIVADEVVIPQSMQSFFSEKVVTLPGCYLPNDDRRLISPEIFTRGEQGLPETGFIFACFNSTQKITSEIFDCWMNLLRQVDGSVLWLAAMNETARANLCREAERRGIAADRLVFARRMDRQEDHLARLGLASLFLDTPGYNAHASACDALWGGLPVLTCIGETFAGRVAASVLTAIGLPELITTTLDEYEAVALTLARDPDRLTALKLKLAANRLSYPLFDTEKFTRHLEAAFTMMHERSLREASPTAFAVPAG